MFAANKYISPGVLQCPAWKKPDYTTGGQKVSYNLKNCPQVKNVYFDATYTLRATDIRDSYANINADTRHNTQVMLSITMFTSLCKAVLKLILLLIQVHNKYNTASPVAEPGFRFKFSKYFANIGNKLKFVNTQNTPLQKGETL